MKPYTKTSIHGLDNLAWRQLRQTGIGGSDAPHLVLTPEEFRYADPERLMRDKVEPLGEEVVTCCARSSIHHVRQYRPQAVRCR